MDGWRDCIRISAYEYDTRPKIICALTTNCRYLVQLTGWEQVEDIVNGLSFMHSLDIVHGDLKLASYHRPKYGDIGSNFCSRRTFSLMEPDRHVLRISA
jgi:hypothetical protein